MNFGLFSAALKYYAVNMTIAQRNLYFKGGVVFSSLCLAALAFLAPKLFPYITELCEQALRRPEGIAHIFAARYSPAVPLAVISSIAAALVYALAALAFIWFFFEKTHSPEILFIGLFVLSFVFEMMRLLIPLQKILFFSSDVLLMGMRFMFFGRFFGVLSLFVSSVYASGIHVQKQGMMVIAMFIAILIIALRIPVSGQSWDTSLAMLAGYSSMFRYIELVLAIVAVMSFLVAAYARETREYLFIATGVLLAFFGRNMLISADTWLVPILGISLLAAGTTLVIMWLRKIYLWL